MKANNTNKKTTKIEKIENVVFLFYLYKNLLTEKQREIFELYYFEDFSTNEIAKQKNISRVAAFDSLKQTEKQLLKFEDGLNLKQKTKELDNNISLLYEELSKDKTNIDENLDVIIQKIKNIF